MLEWGEAHHDYSIWDTAANAGLVFNNTLFDAIRRPGSVWLAHVTLSLREIIDEGCIYPSAGCLVGSVYCAPAFPIGEKKLRLHNLGAYYFLREAVLSQREKNLSAEQKSALTPRILLVELVRPAHQGRAVEGVNYLRLGKLHFDYYSERKVLLNDDELGLERKILENLGKEERFLVQSIELKRKGRSARVDDCGYLSEASEAVKQIPFFGYILFEALTVTLMLCQDDDFSARCRERGEFNNWNYKELMYHFFPEFGTDFRLSKFRPNWEKLIAEVEHRGLLGAHESGEALIRRIARRVRKYICDNSFNEPGSFRGFGSSLQKITWMEAARLVKPLLGQMVHREMRNISYGRYEHFYRLFEETKSRDIWTYWNSKDIAIPFNGVIPKGELGFNPTFHFSRINFYEADAIEVINERDVVVSSGRKLDLIVRPVLSSLQHTFRRDPGERPL